MAAAVDAVEADVLWRESILGVLGSVRVDGGRSFSLFLELRLKDRGTDALLLGREWRGDAMVSRCSLTSSHASILMSGFESFFSLFSADSSDSSCSLETLATALHHVEFETHDTLLSVLALLQLRSVHVSAFLPVPKNPPPVAETHSSNGRPPGEDIPMLRGRGDRLFDSGVVVEDGVVGVVEGALLGANDKKVNADIYECGVCARSSAITEKLEESLGPNCKLGPLRPSVAN